VICWNCTTWPYRIFGRTLGSLIFYCAKIHKADRRYQCISKPGVFQRFNLRMARIVVSLLRDVNLRISERITSPITVNRPEGIFFPIIKVITIPLRSTGMKAKNGYIFHFLSGEHVIFLKYLNLSVYILSLFIFFLRIMLNFFPILFMYCFLF
jgi:hypothetical protein